MSLFSKHFWNCFQGLWDSLLNNLKGVSWRWIWFSEITKGPSGSTPVSYGDQSNCRMPRGLTLKYPGWFFLSVLYSTPKVSFQDRPQACSKHVISMTSGCVCVGGKMMTALKETPCIWICKFSSGLHYQNISSGLDLSYLMGPQFPEVQAPHCLSQFLISNLGTWCVEWISWWKIK